MAITHGSKWLRFLMISSFVSWQHLFIFVTHLNMWFNPSNFLFLFSMKDWRKWCILGVNELISSSLAFNPFLRSHPTTAQAGKDRAQYFIECNRPKMSIRSSGRIKEKGDLKPEAAPGGKFSCWSCRISKVRDLIDLSLFSVLLLFRLISSFFCPPRWNVTKGTPAPGKLNGPWRCR